MKEQNNYYITTTLPYVNAEPHIGFALEIVRADALARWHRSIGDKVFFNTGVDEHGLKIYRKAQELGIEPQIYCDQMAAKFLELKNLLDLSYDSFIRTTDPEHIIAAQEFWKLCEARGDIYKKNYLVKYCVGCELTKTESELVEGKCPDHPNQELETIDEENYFFKFSRYASALLKLYENQAEFVVPAAKLNEIRKFVERGLDDFSVSRLATKMPWGVAVPGDEDQVMYVWFDALVNYISCLGWPNDYKKSLDLVQDDKSYDFARFWPGIQICGKDNLRQQSAMWQAMLLSAGLPTSQQILLNGFITSDGQKMSKSLGNVVSPIELVNNYGTDAVRYFLLAGVNAHEDSDFTKEKFEAVYNADLCNGLGNLNSRISTLFNKFDLDFVKPEKPTETLAKDFEVAMGKADWPKATAVLWNWLKTADEILSNERPWKMEPGEADQCLRPLAENLWSVAYLLQPILPDTSAKLLALWETGKIEKSESLFPRLI